MIDYLLIFLLIVLGIASFLDFKYKAVPSLLLTGSLFVVLMLRPENLFFGVAGLVFAILIKDLIFDLNSSEFGLADIKIMAMIGLLIPNMMTFFLMVVLFVGYQFFYTIIWRSYINQDGEMAFVPCLYALYISLIVLGFI